MFMSTYYEFVSNVFVYKYILMYVYKYSRTYVDMYVCLCVYARLY